ncbi:MAG TPA: VCBS repeat-containing protein, partial [Pyrinomonadaceae bacterium]|nr:VCBS repeat-containing protein [Pyrinomonadaceae bacterium]
MKIFCCVTILAFLLGSGWSQSRPEPAVQRVTFVEVPSAQSKITWTHDNGRSELRHLPETCGGGGLFFDFDNDGWMDIYLVNSGPSDFYVPKTPIKNALYRNNGDGTFSDVTDKAGVACGQ